MEPTEQNQKEALFALIKSLVLLIAYVAIAIVAGLKVYDWYQSGATGMSAPVFVLFLAIMSAVWFWLFPARLPWKKD